jgi:hypothetical protein
MIRAMRPTDSIAAGLLQARGRTREIAAPTWPRTPPESHRPTFLRLLGDLVATAQGERMLGVSDANGRLCGLVVMHARAGGLVWDVEHLLADDDDTAIQLLRWASDRAVKVHGRRVFVDTLPDGEVSSIAPRAGFERYAEGCSYRLEPGFARDQADALPARPRLRSDEMLLFQLYNAAVPANVRAAEALTYEEWTALYPGRKLWAPSIIGDRQDFVWELGPLLIGWMRVIFGQRSQYLYLLLHPSYENYGQRMICNALGQLSAKAPVLLDVREYQGGVRAALEALGFRRGPEYASWVRHLTERVKEPSIAAVGAPV